MEWAYLHGVIPFKVQREEKGRAVRPRRDWTASKVTPLNDKRYRKPNLSRKNLLRFVFTGRRKFPQPRAHVLFANDHPIPQFPLQLRDVNLSGRDEQQGVPGDVDPRFFRRSYAGDVALGEGGAKGQQQPPLPRRAAHHVHRNHARFGHRGSGHHAFLPEAALAEANEHQKNNASQHHSHATPMPTGLAWLGARVILAPLLR